MKHHSPCILFKAAKQLGASRPAGWRPAFTQAVAVLSLAIWLLLAVAEVCPSFHAWLHGGSIPDDDNCAVVAVAHGNVNHVICAAPAVVPVIGIEAAPRIEFSTSNPAPIFIVGGRGPPSSFVS